MSKLKVLECPIHQMFRDDPTDYFGERPEIPAVFNRDGYYYDRTTLQCWIECNGRAWLYDAGSFLYELKCLTALERPFTAEQNEAMKVLRHRCNRKDKVFQNYLDWSAAEQSRNIYRDSRKYCMISLREFRRSIAT